MLLTQNSITRRLIFASLASIPLFLTFTGFALQRAQSESLLQAEQEQLKLLLYGLLGAIEWEDATPIISDRLKEPRYSQFRSGLYAAITDGKDLVFWQSLSSESLELPFTSKSRDPILKPGEPAFDQVRTPNGKLFRYRYYVIWEDDFGNETPLGLNILASRDSYLTESRSFQKALVIWMSIVAIVLIVVQGFILRWGLSPLRLLAKELGELESGARGKLSDEHPIELQGITGNLNKLLSKEKNQRERYHRTLGDLAHSLKTPLSVLQNVLAGKTTDVDLAKDQVGRMNDIVAYQLRRAVNAGSNRFGERVGLEALISRITNTMLKVYRDKSVELTLNVSSEHLFAGDENDLMEVLGNLIDNAFKASESAVQVSSKSIEDGIEIAIEDDGAGIPESKREALAERGARGDQYGAGHGLGLSIVKDIVAAYEGELQFTDSETLGGAKIIVRLFD